MDEIAITHIPRTAYPTTRGHWHWLPVQGRATIVMMPPMPNSAGYTWDCLCPMKATHKLRNSLGNYMLGEPLFHHRAW